MAKHPYRSLHIYGGDNHWPRQSALGWQPRVDVYRTESEVLIQIEAPGVDEASLRVHFEPGQIIVEGRRERPRLPSTSRCLCVEIEYGAFRRAIALPPDIQADAIDARYQSGLLLIVVPLKRAAPVTSLRVNID